VYLQDDAGEENFHLYRVTIDTARGAGAFSVRSAAAYVHFVPPADVGREQPEGCIVLRGGREASVSARVHGRCRGECRAGDQRDGWDAAVLVHIAGSTAVPWYFDGCELSWTDV
jgi:hypothetical protein